MPLYLADTSAWNRSTATADQWAELLARNEIAICGPVQLELLYSARGRSDFEALKTDLDLLPYVALDEHGLALAARAQQALAATGQHRGPKAIDLLVAGAAEAAGATVLHYDRHFDAIARVTGQPTRWLARRGSLD